MRTAFRRGCRTTVVRKSGHTAVPGGGSREGFDLGGLREFARG